MPLEVYPTFHESTAIASSSKARWHPPSPLSEASQVKAEARTPVLPASYQSFSHPYGTDMSPADTHIEYTMSSMLISSPSSPRHRPLALQPTTTHLNPNSAILFSRQKYIPQTHHPQHDVDPLLSASFTSDLSESTGQHGFLCPPPQRLPSSTPSRNHVSLNSSPRWTSSHPVITTPSALAAHHGIPQSLPPVPRTTRYQQEKSTSSSSPLSSNNDFDTLCSSYLSMLSHKTENHTSEDTNASMNAVAPNDAAAVQALIEVLQASPEFRDASGDFGAEFLTSPLDESPWEEMLTTPALESGDNMSADILTSPAIIDSDDFGFGSMPLFSDALSYSRTLEPVKTSPMVQHPVFDGLYTMPSPDTPSLDPSSMNASPSVAPVDTPSLTSFDSPMRRKNSPTGTRKNVTPESLIPFDAPIQPRKYLTPSATSRKEVPAVFKKKRSRSIAFEEEEDGEELGQNVDLDAIEAKRRQNTLAARRSRKRKLEYQRELEAAVEKEKEEKDQWRTKAMFYKALLESHGHDIPNI